MQDPTSSSQSTGREPINSEPTHTGPSTVNPTGQPAAAEHPDPARNFSSISPSAYALLLMKGLTAIPYAREAAALLNAARPLQPDSDTGIDTSRPAFWLRLLHFENRYWSIDQLMADLPVTNILEISSGFSFRGLALSRRQAVHYIDTDLPDLIATKQTFVDALTAADANAQTGAPADATHTSGLYELLALNVLDETAFNAIIDRFPPGELLILNEGLLVYLDQQEKEQLCRIIHKILQRRGGYWITADIYVKHKFDRPAWQVNDRLTEFFEKHKIEENKFADFDTATAFFTRMGFAVDKEAVNYRHELTGFSRLMATLPPDALEKAGQTPPPKIHATWRLRVANP